MGALMRSHDWSKTPLGPVGSWPQSLRTSVSTCLNSRFAIVIWWGPDLVMLYNDAYRDIIASKHPAALGRPGRECEVAKPNGERTCDKVTAAPANQYPGFSTSAWIFSI